MKKMPIEERKVSTTFALSRDALEKLDKIQEHFFPGKSRSFAVEELVAEIFNEWFSDQELSSVYGGTSCRASR